MKVIMNVLVIGVVYLIAIASAASTPSHPQITFTGTGVQSLYLQHSDQLLMLTKNPNQLVAWSWLSNNSSVVIQFPDQPLGMSVYESENGDGVLAVTYGAAAYFYGIRTWHLIDAMAIPVPPTVGHFAVAPNGRFYLSQNGLASYEIKTGIMTKLNVSAFASSYTIQLSKDDPSILYAVSDGSQASTFLTLNISTPAGVVISSTYFDGYGYRFWQLNNATLVSAAGSIYRTLDRVSYSLQYQGPLNMPLIGSGTYNQQPSAVAQSPVTGSTVGAFFASSLGGFPFQSYIYVMSDAIGQQQMWLELPKIQNQLPSVSALYWDASGENAVAVLTSGSPSQLTYTGIQIYRDYWQPIVTPLLGVSNPPYGNPLFVNSSQSFVDATYLTGIDRIAVLSTMPDELLILDPRSRQITAVAMLKLPVAPQYQSNGFQGTYIATDDVSGVIAVAHINHVSVYRVLDNGNALELLYLITLSLDPLTGPTPVSVAVGPKYVYAVGPQWTQITSVNIQTGQVQLSNSTVSFYGGYLRYDSPLDSLYLSSSYFGMEHFTSDSTLIRSSSTAPGGQHFWIAPNGQWMLSQASKAFALSNTNATADMSAIGSLRGGAISSASIVAGPSRSQQWLVAVIPQNTATVQIIAVPSNELLDTITLPYIIQQGVSQNSVGQFVWIQPDQTSGVYWITAIIGGSPQSGIYRRRWVASL